MVPALVALAIALATLRGWRHLRRLPPAPDDAPAPDVTVISPACNEEDAIAESVATMLATGSEVVVVDDRSTDGTGRVLDDLAEREDRLEVVHVHDLPDGWLGKVHALERGTEKARGEWLLYADADAQLRPDTLRRAVAHMEREKLDFLSLMPRITSAGFWGDTVFALAQAMICLGTRPWAITDPEGHGFGATGAFMLVRRTAFERTPGFEWLKMEISDDFGLCLLLKEHGGRCTLLDGSDAVSLQWYGSLSEMVRRMQKNFFAITGRCRPWRCYAQAIVSAALAFLPFGVLLGGPAAWLSGSASLALVLTAVACAWRFRRPLLPAVFVHLGALFMAYMQARAGFIGGRLGGVEWRGTVYSSAKIDAGRRVLL
jgi:glycosyltransferase involved in cell wall biosynthesis